MPNITLSVDEEIIKKVRKIAIEKDTTLTQMVRDFLTSVAERSAAGRKKAARRLDASLRKYARDMGEREWTRESLYER